MTGPPANTAVPDKANTMKRILPGTMLPPKLIPLESAKKPKLDYIPPDYLSGWYQYHPGQQQERAFPLVLLSSDGSVERPGRIHNPVGSTGHVRIRARRRLSRNYPLLFRTRPVGTELAGRDAFGI